MNDKELVKKEENASGGTEDSSSKKVTAWKIAAFENNRLRPDDILAFSCDNCGECCRNQNDLIMNPYDIFRMAKRLDMTPKEIRTNEPEVVYFHSGCKCGTEQSGQTVKKWLDSFGLMEREYFFIRWTKVIREVSAFVRSLEKTMDDEEILKTIWGLIILQLYVDYDIHQDFEPQFEKNIKELQEHMEKIQGIRRAYHEGELQ